MKQALTEALSRETPYRSGDLKLILAAARLVERLLPGECDRALGKNCPFCFNTGRVWDEGIVEAVARAIYKVVYPDREMDKPKTQDFYKAEARAVLSVLADL